MTQLNNNGDLMEKGAIEPSVEYEGGITLNPTQQPVSPTFSIGTTIQEPQNVNVQPMGLKGNWIHQLAEQIRRPFHRLQNIATSRNPPPKNGGMPIVRTLQECPEGYPRLAALLDSDENFMLYRRFGWMQSRILLQKQDELRELERDLELVDGVDENTQRKIVLQSREKYDARCEERKKLLDNIATKFKDYGQLLSIARELASFNRPPPRDYLSVKSYFDEERPLCNNESFIYCKEDIITLKPGRENAWLDAFVERILQNFTCKFVRYLFCSPELCKKADREKTGIILYSRERIDFVVSLLITMMILALLIVPVYILWHLTRAVPTNTTTASIFGILLVFTLIFSGVLSLFTRARRHEILGSAAAYCAVLVVFMSNIGQFSGVPKN